MYACMELCMLQGMKAGKAVGHNLSLMAGFPSLCLSLANNIKRVADDLALAQDVINMVIEEQKAITSKW